MKEVSSFSLDIVISTNAIPFSKTEKKEFLNFLQRTDCSCL